MDWNCLKNKEFFFLSLQMCDNRKRIERKEKKLQPSLTMKKNLENKGGESVAG
jgi:hypothetical protein